MPQWVSLGCLAQFRLSSQYANTKHVYWRVSYLSSAAFRSSYQPVKELLNVSNAASEVI
jgi:hypothetical protein